MEPSKLWSINDGELTLHLHDGQYRAMESRKRFVFMFAGTQGGKTALEPWWLAREIERCGGGDHLAVTATFDLFKLKFLPVMREVFEDVLRIGRYWSGDRVIEIRDPSTGKFWAKRADDTMWGRIILRSAEAKGGLESSTVRSALMDEAGLDSYTVGTWQAVRRRLSLSQGRVLAGTTIYNLGWVKTEIYDPWKAAQKDGGEHPEIDVIQFDSIMNPWFPVDEYESARASMPEWQFNMFYRGLFERPAGLIYDSFNETLCVVPPIAIPERWPRHLGLDFGGVNTAGVYIAEEPGTTSLWVYRTYLAGGRTAAEHSKYLMEGEPGLPTSVVGGSHSEGQWRKEFHAGGIVEGVRVAGLPVMEPDIKDVFLGIGRVYGAHKRNEIKVFNTLTGYLKEKRSYSYKVDESGAVKEPKEIEGKSRFHLLDAERYIVGRLRRGDRREFKPAVGGQRKLVDKYKAR